MFKMLLRAPVILGVCCWISISSAIPFRMAPKDIEQDIRQVHSSEDGDKLQYFYRSKRDKYNNGIAPDIRESDYFYHPGSTQYDYYNYNSDSSEAYPSENYPGLKASPDIEKNPVIKILAGDNNVSPGIQNSEVISENSIENSKSSDSEDSYSSENSAEDLKNSDLNSKESTDSPDSKNESNLPETSVLEKWISTKCSRSARKSSDRYSSSFASNNTKQGLNEDTFPNPGEAEAVKSSSVFVGEDVTLCWIETITIKEDKSIQPPKKVVLREFTISFENSATIPEKYLECSKLEGEIEPGCQNFPGKTGIFDAVDEDSKVSKLVNFTTISTKGNIEVRQHKNVRCAVGPVVTKNVIEFKDGSKNSKKRVEIKVSPRLRKIGENGESCPSEQERGVPPTKKSEVEDSLTKRPKAKLEKESEVKDSLTKRPKVKPEKEFGRMTMKLNERPGRINEELKQHDSFDKGPPGKLLDRKSVRKPHESIKGKGTTPNDDISDVDEDENPGYEDAKPIGEVSDGTPGLKDDVTEIEDSGHPEYTGFTDDTNIQTSTSGKEILTDNPDRESSGSSEETGKDNFCVGKDCRSELDDLTYDDTGLSTESTTRKIPADRKTSGNKRPVEVTTTEKIGPSLDSKESESCSGEHCPEVDKSETESLTLESTSEDERKIKQVTTTKKYSITNGDSYMNEDFTTQGTVVPDDETGSTKKRPKTILDAENGSESCEDDCSSCSGEDCSTKPDDSGTEDHSTKIPSSEDDRNLPKTDDTLKSNKEITESPTADEEINKLQGKDLIPSLTTARKLSNVSAVTDLKNETSVPGVEPDTKEPGELPTLLKKKKNPKITDGSQTSEVESATRRPPNETGVPDILEEESTKRPKNMPSNNLIRDEEPKKNSKCESEDCLTSSEDMKEFTEGLTKSPEGSTKFPEASTKSPEGSIKSEDSTKSPKSSTKSPEDSTKSPEGSTKSPEDSSKSPEGSTKSPEGSTKSPEGSTKSPEGSTPVSKSKSPVSRSDSSEENSKPLEETTKSPENILESDETSKAPEYVSTKSAERVAETSKSDGSSTHPESTTKYSRGKPKSKGTSKGTTHLEKTTLSPTDSEPKISDNKKVKKRKHEPDVSEDMSFYSDEEEPSSSTSSSVETTISPSEKLPKNLTKESVSLHNNSKEKISGKVPKTTEESLIETTTSQCPPNDEECIFKSKTSTSEPISEECDSSSSQDCLKSKENKKKSKYDKVKSTTASKPKEMEVVTEGNIISIIENGTSPSLSSTLKHKLGLRIKILLEHINQNDERKNLIEVDKHLLLSEDSKDHDNNTVLNQIKALNDSVTAQTIKALLNCTTLEKLSSKGLSIEVDEATLVPKRKVGDKNLEPNELIVSVEDKKTDGEGLDKLRRKRGTSDGNSTDGDFTSGTTTEAGSTDGIDIETGSTDDVPTSYTEGDSTEANSAEVNTTEDNTTEDNTTKDNTTENNTTEDNTIEDNTTEDNTTENNTTEDNTTEDNTTEENSTKVNNLKTNNTKCIVRNDTDTNENKNQSQFIKDCLPDLQQDINTGINHVISKLENCTNLNCFPEVQDPNPLPISDILGIISNPTDSRIHSRTKRDTKDHRKGKGAFQKLDNWSNVRIRRDAGGHHLRSLTEFTIFREA